MNFTLVKRGYDTLEVDNYIKNLEQQLNEYKEKSSAINKAIINAQLAADNMIREANKETEKMLSDAKTEAYSLKQETLNQIGGLKQSIALQESFIQSFQKDYNSLLERYLKPLNEDNFEDMLKKLNNLNNIIDELTSSQNNANNSIVQEAAITETVKEFKELDSNEFDDVKLYREQLNTQQKPFIQQENPNPFKNAIEENINPFKDQTVENINPFKENMINDYKYNDYNPNEMQQDNYSKIDNSSFSAITKDELSELLPNFKTPKN